MSSVSENPRAASVAAAHPARSRERADGNWTRVVGKGGGHGLLRAWSQTLTLFRQSAVFRTLQSLTGQ